MVPRALRAARTQARGSARASDACWLERGGCVVPYSAAREHYVCSVALVFWSVCASTMHWSDRNGESCAGVWPCAFREVGRFSGMNLGSNGIIAEHPVYINTRAIFLGVQAAVCEGGMLMSWCVAG